MADTNRYDDFSLLSGSLADEASDEISGVADVAEHGKSDIGVQGKLEDKKEVSSEISITGVTPSEEPDYFHYEDEVEDEQELAESEFKERSLSSIMVDAEEIEIDQDLDFLIENLPPDPVIDDLVIRAGSCLEDIQKLPESLVPGNLVEVFTEMIETVILHRKAHELCVIRTNKQNETLLAQEQCIDELKEKLKQTEEVVAEKDENILGYQQKLDDFHLREHRLQEELEIHTAEVKHLHEEMQRRDDIQADIEEEIGTSGRAREAYARQKQKLKEQMDAVERTLTEMKDERDKVIDLHKSSVLQIEDLRKEIVAKNELLVHREKLLAKLDYERNDLRKAISNSNKIFRLVHKSFLHFEKHMIKLEQANFAQAAQIDGLLRKTTDVFRQNIYYANEGTKCKKQIIDLQESYDYMFRYLQKQEIKLREQLLKVRELERSLSVLDRKHAKASYERNKAVSDKDAMINEFLSYEKSIKQKDHIIEKSRMKINSLISQLERYQRIINDLRDQKRVAMKKVDESLIKLSSEKSEQLVQNEEITKLKRDLEKVNMVKQRLLSDNTTLMQKIEEGAEEIRFSKAEVYGAKKQLVDMDRQQSQLIARFNDIIEEKNLLSSKYVECKLKLSNQEGKVRLSDWQIENLKEEMRLKDRMFKNKDIESRRYHFAKRKMEIHYKTIHRNYTELKQRTGGENKDLIDLQLELKTYIRRTKDLEGQGEKDKAEVGTLRTQLDRRVTEIAILNERVEVLSSLLSRGEAQYNQRIEDIRLLKIEVKKLRWLNHILYRSSTLEESINAAVPSQTSKNQFSRENVSTKSDRREKGILVKGFQNNADLRSEIYFLHKDLSEERQKSKALQEQLENPLNYHRWRLLEGTDPSKKEMIDKLLMLQKKLYTATKQVAVQKTKFDDLQTLYNAVKHKFEMMPSSEELARLGETKLMYRRKCDEFKTLESHVVALERELRDYKIEITTLKQELNDVKKSYYELKIKENRRKLSKSGNMLPKLQTPKASYKC